METEMILDEWTMLKETLYSRKDKPSSETWASINKLIDLVLTLPASTADCERGFNHMKMIKSDWRSKLRADRLTDLMRILLDSPPISEFDPRPAVELWHAASVRARRPEAMDFLALGTTEEEEAEEDADSFMVVKSARIVNVMAVMYSEELQGATEKEN